MGKWDIEIEKAKQETVVQKKFAWQEQWNKNWLKNNKKEYSHTHVIPRAPEPPKEVIEVKAWFIGQWDTGFIVCDLEELMKEPKKKRDKILALGGLT